MGLFSPIMSIIFNYFFHKLFQQCNISHPSNYIYFKWGWKTLLPGDFNICVFLSPLTLAFLCWDEIASSLRKNELASEWKLDMMAGCFRTTAVKMCRRSFWDEGLGCSGDSQDGHVLLTARPGRPWNPLCPLRPGLPLCPLSPGSPLSPRMPWGPCKEREGQRGFLSFKKHDTFLQMLFNQLQK